MRDEHMHARKNHYRYRYTENIHLLITAMLNLFLRCRYGHMHVAAPHHSL